MSSRDSNSNAVLEVRGAERKFGSAAALAGVDLTLREGELKVLLGPSGCGKTTLLRSIAGLERLGAGTIELRGRDITRLSPDARDVALVFQDGGLFPHLTVRKNVAIALRRSGYRWRHALRAPQVDDAIAKVSMTPYAQRRPHELSGGQRQRVGIARALVGDPQLLLMDEPFASLDADLRLDLRRELRRMHLDGQVTETIFVTHDQTEALGIADRIAVMFDGRVVQEGTPTELLKWPATLGVARFLGVPRITLLPEVEGVVFAVRPTDFVCSARSDVLNADGVILACEPFAGGSLLTIRTNGGVEFEVAASARDQAGIGAELALSVGLDAVHVFSAVTNERQHLDPSSSGLSGISRCRGMALTPRGTS